MTVPRVLAACFVVGVLVLTLATLIGTEGERALERAPYRNAVHVCDLNHPELDEVSGMTPSRSRAGVFWLVNDSGHEPLLYAVRPDGTHLGTVRISGIENLDWEDMSSFCLGNSGYLLIADVGDNGAERDYCEIHVVKEPEMGPAGPKASSVGVAWMIRFRYEDGPRDCEAVAVDVIGESVLLLSKRDRPPVLYRLPLLPSKSDADSVACRLVESDGIPLPTPADVEGRPLRGRWVSQPTSMDISPDGSEVVVLTYKHAYLFQRVPTEQWTTTMKRAPMVLKLPQLLQTEAICHGVDGEALFITSEGRPAPMYRLDRLTGQ